MEFGKRGNCQTIGFNGQRVNNVHDSVIVNSADSVKTVRITVKKLQSIISILFLIIHGSLVILPLLHVCKKPITEQ